MSFNKHSEGVSRQFTNSVHLWRPRRDELENMIKETEECTSLTSDELDLEMSGEEEIRMEIVKVKYFSDPTDELVEGKDFKEIELVMSKMEEIHRKISNLILHFEEMNIEAGKSARAV